MLVYRNHPKARVSICCCIEWSGSFAKEEAQLAGDYRNRAVGSWRKCLSVRIAFKSRQGGYAYYHRSSAFRRYERRKRPGVLQRRPDRGINRRTGEGSRPECCSSDFELCV